jgi:AcrR family transcriptional regulator
MKTLPPAQKRSVRKRDQSEESIDKILSSALNLMVTHGFGATTVDEIARSAGLTKGAVYFHFESKTAILMALLDSIEKLLIGGLMDRVLHAGPSQQDKLVAALHAQGALAETKAQYMLLFTLILLEFNGTKSVIEERVRRIYLAFAESFEKIVRNGKASGEFSQELGVREMVAVVLALQHGTLLEWYCRSEVLDGPALVRAARQVLLGGIRTRLDGARLAS